jgi:ubiquinone/menaquinone biosynthesis C-methylase UbiE
MTSKQQGNARTQAAYHAAADRYDQPALSFWERFGRATVARLGLKPGALVLDVCCGSGASALAAAQTVGPTGRVLGVDLAEGLVERARVKARERGFQHAEFRVGDFEELAEPDGSFDAVICIFGIFFLPDMPAGVRRLWRWVKPGGKLAITTWGPRVFEPANTIFWEAIRDVRPELYKGFNPWDRINDPVAVSTLLAEAGVADSAAIAEAGWHPIATPADWWTIVMGSGYRGVIEQLTPEERVRVQTTVLSAVARWDVRLIETNVVFATAQKM